jgi:archaellum biogenesis ATPase FlaH
MHDISIEKLILQNLVTNEAFTRQALPYIKEEYFEDKGDAAISVIIDEYFKKTNELPHKNIMLIEVKENDKLHEKDAESARSTIFEICDSEPLSDVKWLLEQTEQWCRDRAMYLSIVKAISIYDGTDKTMTSHSIPDMIKDALAISFETKIGSDWYDDAESRFERYEYPLNKIVFDLETLNEITFGGVTKKTLSIILAGVHVGKTLSMVHFAAGYARLGYNVLYFSMEMGEDEIMQRIDANMLKVSMHQIKDLGKEKFMGRMHHLKQKSYGKIKVIQYPTSLAHTGHFRMAMDELKLKMQWAPDVVMVDYLGIVASSRIKVGATNSHFYLKSVAEELRAMAIELDVAVWSAMQLTRSGMSSSDVEMTDIAESIGIPGVCDFMLAASRNDEMDAVGQISYKQLKNRFRNMSYRPRFILGSEFEQQLLLDVAESQQTLSEPVAHIDSRKIQEKFENKFNKQPRGRLTGIDMGDY